MTELIEATVFRPIVEPYSEQELDNLPSHMAQLMRRENFHKVTGEEQVASIKTNNRDELRYRVIDLYYTYKPNPLLVKLNNKLDRTFIVDKLSGKYDAEAIVERIYFTYNERGKEIQKDIQKLMEQDMHELQEPFSRILSESGIDKTSPWSALKKIRDGQINTLTEDEMLNLVRDPNPLLRLLRNPNQDEKSVSKELNDIHSKYLKRAYSELSEKFGIKKEFSYDIDININPYTITARVQTREHQPLDLTTVLYDFIEERGRLIVMGNNNRDHESWFKKFHPEMYEEGLQVTQNSLDFDGTMFIQKDTVY